MAEVVLDTGLLLPSSMPIPSYHFLIVHCQIHNTENKFFQNSDTDILLLSLFYLFSLDIIHFLIRVMNLK